MTSPYEESYPPEILRGYEPPVLSGGAARRTATSSATGTLTVTEGEPGTYEPELAPGERPRNVTELRDRARPAADAPWAEGAYVLIGTSGKRAHWGGDDWHGGESPGYTELKVAEGEPGESGTLEVDPDSQVPGELVDTDEDDDE